MSSLLLAEPRHWRHFLGASVGAGVAASVSAGVGPAAASAAAAATSSAAAQDTAASHAAAQRWKGGAGPSQRDGMRWGGIGGSVSATGTHLRRHARARVATLQPVGRPAAAPQGRTGARLAFAAPHGTARRGTAPVCTAIAIATEIGAHRPTHLGCQCSCHCFIGLHLLQLLGRQLEAHAHNRRTEGSTRAGQGRHG